ncbi:MAG: sigma-70 family RNA polymerase sigma factor [Pirellulaceae bacterium]
MSKSLWPSSDPTGELLIAAKAGSTQAVNDLLDRHREPVRKLVKMRLDRRVQQRVDVSDVVQDVMVEANARLADYMANPSMSFHLWLRQIAWDHMIDAYRRHRGSAKRSLDREQSIMGPVADDQSTMEMIIQLRDPELTPAAAAAQSEIAKRVEATINELDPNDREIIMMRHFEHLSNQEVADVLGLKPPAASMRYLRAVRRLRELLEGL